LSFVQKRGWREIEKLQRLRIQHEKTQTRHVQQIPKRVQQTPKHGPQKKRGTKRSGIVARWTTKQKKRKNPMKQRKKRTKQKRMKSVEKSPQRERRSQTSIGQLSFPKKPSQIRGRP